MVPPDCSLTARNCRLGNGTGLGDEHHRTAVSRPENCRLGNGVLVKKGVVPLDCSLTARVCRLGRWHRVKRNRHHRTAVSRSENCRLGNGACVKEGATGLQSHSPSFWTWKVAPGSVMARRTMNNSGVELWE
ncbi:hypothetical protein Zmor_021716 [Zophobas morio]|uniref:Uncharacterized protein n=1 Tax=Zophobas morio TaxID=2755281 RepID=A0AA38MB66_9CUCU|nr:hypothetical protein Zmor_021716 [Zophobas morio]